MELSGEQNIAAPRQKVWEALNDPRVLQACIPGCESLEQDGDKGFAATVLVKIGPIKARFAGTVALSNIRPPESYTISGEGKGGAAGMAKGGADIVLVEDGEGTLLRYTVKADVGGKLAQIGSRLVQSTANKYSRDFFSRFGDIVTGAVPLAALETAAAAAPAAMAPSPTVAAAPVARGGPADENAIHIRRLNWALLAIVVALVAYILATL